jgi:uncharacterized lipoprotein YmbA
MQLMIQSPVRSHAGEPPPARADQLRATLCGHRLQGRYPGVVRVAAEQIFLSVGAGTCGTRVFAVRQQQRATGANTTTSGIHRHSSAH